MTISSVADSEKKGYSHDHEITIGVVMDVSWQSQIFAKVLMWATVIMVTAAPREMVEDLHMQYASSLPEALVMADKVLGHNKGSITAIPDGIGVIVHA